jgi:hypothetical protein
MLIDYCNSQNRRNDHEQAPNVETNRVGDHGPFASNEMRPAHISAKPMKNTPTLGATGYPVTFLREILSSF